MLVGAGGVAGQSIAGDLSAATQAVLVLCFQGCYAGLLCCERLQAVMPALFSSSSWLPGSAPGCTGNSQLVIPLMRRSS
jgi:hypothetical protein